jgi:hypothetical protein
MIETEFQFSEGLAPFLDKSGKYGYVNKDGIKVIKSKFDMVGPFKEGYAIIGTWMNQTSLKLDMIKSNGHPISLPPSFILRSSNNRNGNRMPCFQNGYFKLEKAGDTAPRFYDKTGQCPKIFQSFEAIGDFNDDNLAQVRSPSPNIIDKQGNIVEVFRNSRKINISSSPGSLPFVSSLKNNLYHGYYLDLWGTYHRFYKLQHKLKTISNSHRNSFKFATNFDNDIALVKTRRDKIYFIGKNFRKKFNLPRGWVYPLYYDSNKPVLSDLNESYHY